MPSAGRPPRRSTGRRPPPRSTRTGQKAGRRALAHVEAPRGGDRDPVKAKRRTRSRVARRRTRVALALGVSVVLVGFLFAFYFPTRTWLAQRQTTQAATTKLDALTHANKVLAARVRSLKDPATIARLARSEYGMVKPGEKAYLVLPPATGATALPEVWPFERSATPAAQSPETGAAARSSAP